MGGQTNGQTDRPTDIQMYCTVSLEMDRYMDTNIKDTQPARHTHRHRRDDRVCTRRYSLTGHSTLLSHTHLSAALTEEVSFQGWSGILRNIRNTVHSMEVDSGTATTGTTFTGRIHSVCWCTSLTLYLTIIFMAWSTVTSATATHGILVVYATRVPIKV